MKALTVPREGGTGKTRTCLLSGEKRSFVYVSTHQKVRLPAGGVQGDSVQLIMLIMNRMDSFPVLSMSWRSPPSLCVSRRGRNITVLGASQLQGRPVADPEVKEVTCWDVGSVRAEIFFIRLSINESSPPRIKPGTQETLEEPLPLSDCSQVGSGDVKCQKVQQVCMNVP